MTIFASGPKEDKLMSIAKMKKGFKKRFGILAIMLIIFGAMPALGATYSASGDHTTISALKPQAIIKLVSTNSGEAPLQVKVKDVSTGTVLYKKWYVDNEIVSRDQKQTELVRTFDNKGTKVEKHVIRLRVSDGPTSSEDSCTIYVYPRKSTTADKIVYKFDKDNGKDGKSPWGVLLKDLPVYNGYHLPAKEGYMSVESQYNFIDDTTGKDYTNPDPTNGNGYYFNTLSPDNMQWKWDGHNKLLGTIKLIPGSQDHVSDLNGKRFPSGKGAKIRIYSPYTGKAVIAVVGENGPAPWTGRQFGASNKVFKALGLPDKSKDGKFSKGNPNPGHGSKNSDPANYPVVKYANNPYWVEVSWADQSLPGGPSK